MKTLIILNDPPYGTERSYNGLRLANFLAGAEATVRVFLFADAAACARRGQRVPSGYYNLETMLSGLVKRGVEVGICGSCMDARGIGEGEIVEGTRRSSMVELTQWVLWTDKVISF